MKLRLLDSWGGHCVCHGIHAQLEVYQVDQCKEFPSFSTRLWYN
jgi:hypothetical protein